jgi:hypothetical protein
VETASKKLLPTSSYSTYTATTTTEWDNNNVSSSIVGWLEMEDDDGRFRPTTVDFGIQREEVIDSIDIDHNFYAHYQLNQ